MAQINFSGPVEVVPELLMAMWAVMPPENQAAYSQLFFSQYARPQSDFVLAAGAKMLFERCEIPKVAEKAIRDGVIAKCKELGKKVNPEQLNAVVADELRKASLEVAKGKAAAAIADLTAEQVSQALLPALAQVAQQLAHRYFHQLPEGQQKILKLLAEVVDSEVDSLRAECRRELHAAAKPVIARNMAMVDLTADSNGLDKETAGNLG